MAESLLSTGLLLGLSFAKSFIDAIPAVHAQLGAVMDTVAATLTGVGGIALSRKTIDNTIWPRFRCVAHLWAAYLWGAAPGDRTFPCRLDRLADSLTVAEWFRAEGEGFRPKGSDRTVLSAAESWRMPDGLLAVSVKPF